MLAAAGWFAVGVGALMLAWWGVELRGGVLERPDRQRSEIVLHVAAEALTALLLLVGGAAVLLGDPPGITSIGVLLVAFGMLLSTVVQSPGYFLARGERGPVVMFVALQVLTVLAILATLRG